MLLLLKRLGCFVFICALFLVQTSSVDAQLLPPGFKEQVTVTVLPSVPSPNSSVTASIESYSTNLQRATITWATSDGQKAQGVGKTKFTFTSPPTGIIQQVVVTITKESGEVLSENFTVAPAGVDLLVSGETYTPPFYKGRSLFTPQSIVTIAAIPELITGGVRADPKKLIYTWEKNDQVLQDISGYGKDTVRFVGSVLSQPFMVTVTVEAPNSDVRARKRIAVNPTNPKVLVYENNPLYGNVFEKAITSRFRFDREEVGLTAIPYFFSVETKNDRALSYVWLENNAAIKDPALGADLTFTNKDLLRSGLSKIVVGASHLSNMLQNARIDFALDVIGNETLETQINQGNVTVF